MHQGTSEVKKISRAEKKERRRAIKQNRNGSGLNSPKLSSGMEFKPANLLKGCDFLVILLIVLLSLFGVAMVFSAGYYETINSSDPDPTFYLFRQLMWVGLGLVLMTIFANIDYHLFLKISGIIIAVSIILLVLVMAVGSTVNNAQRWLYIGGIGITPSEFSKLAVIIFTSCFLAKNPDNIKSFGGILILLAIMAVHFILIYKQPNLSTAIVIVAIMGAIMLVGGLNIPITLISGTALAFAGYKYIMKFNSSTHWYKRLTSFTDPFKDMQGDGYQVSQGLIALGNGGLKGLGFGRSIAKNLYLPEPQNDFILAIIGEELGYLGFLLLMLVYIILLFKLMMIALNAPDRLGFYLVTGVAVMLGLQVIINVAVVTSSMPATGITLPFISYGGTSILSFMMSMGIVLNVSRKRKAESS